MSVIQRAEAVYRNNENKSNFVKQVIELEGIVLGDGFQKKTLRYGLQRSAMVILDGDGKAITAYPKYGK